MVVYADYVRRALISAATGLSEYRVAQRSLDHLRVELQFRDPEGNQTACDAVRDALSELFRGYSAKLPTIDVVHVSSILFPRDSKRKRVVREM